MSLPRRQKKSGDELGSESWLDKGQEKGRGGAGDREGETGKRRGEGEVGEEEDREKRREA